MNTAVIVLVFVLAHCGAGSKITATDWSQSPTDRSLDRSQKRFFCNETILLAVHRLFPGRDSKYFVDQPTKIPLQSILDKLERRTGDGSVVCLLDSGCFGRLLNESLLEPGKDCCHGC
jgi:hypothetical protein